LRILKITNTIESFEVLPLNAASIKPFLFNNTATVVLLMQGDFKVES